MTKGWIIARGPSNGNFALHNAISRPIIGYYWDDERTRLPQYGKGPACYTPVDITLKAKNQYTRKKNEPRSELLRPKFPGYTFILDPDLSLIRDLIDRKKIYDLIPAPARASNNYEPEPLRLSQSAIMLMRDRFQDEYDPVTGSGYRVSIDPKARMQPGYEFEVGDYVLSGDPAWEGHKLKCIGIADRKARVICEMFGIDHEVDVDIGGLRKTQLSA